jgi:hypothetical protein
MIGPNGWPDAKAELVADETRCRVEVQTTSGRAAAVEFRVRLDTVDMWIGNHHCSGVFVRETLQRWLADPVGRLVADEVELSLDRSVDREGRVALTLVDAATNLPDVAAWTLSPGELLDLRKRTDALGDETAAILRRPMPAAPPGKADVRDTEQSRSDPPARPKRPLRDHRTRTPNRRHPRPRREPPRLTSTRPVRDSPTAEHLKRGSTSPSRSRHLYARLPTPV